MQRVTGLFGGRSGHGSLYEDEDDHPNDRKETLRPSSATASPKPEAPVPMNNTAAWDQAATIRAQLEAELKRDGIVSRSPPDVRASPSQRSRPLPVDVGRDRIGSGGISPRMSAQSPNDGDASPNEFGPEGDGSRKRAKDKSKKRPKGSPGDAFGGLTSSDFTWDTGVGGFSWPAPAAATVASAQMPGRPLPSAEKPTNGFVPSAAGTPWGVEQPASPALSPAVSPEKQAPATPVASSISPRKVEEVVEVDARAEAESVPLVTPLPAAPSGPAAPELEQAPLEPLTGLFDEAILGALVALPQQALVSFLRRLAQQRPAEVALALGRDLPNTSVASANTPVATPVPEAAASGYAELPEASASLLQDGFDSDPGLAGATTFEGQSQLLLDTAPEALSPSVDRVVADTSSTESTSPVPPAAVPPSGSSDTTAARMQAESLWSSAAGSTGGALAGTAQGNLWPTSTASSIWPPAAPVVAPGPGQAGAATSPASPVPAAASPWPSTAWAKPAEGASAAGLWPTATQKTEWPRY